MRTHACIATGPSLGRYSTQRRFGTMLLSAKERRTKTEGHCPGSQSNFQEKMKFETYSSTAADGSIAGETTSNIIDAAAVKL